jgi:YHS domain-containing protein
MKKAFSIISLAFVLSCLLTACGQKNNNTTNTATTTAATADTAKKYTLAMVVNKKDLSCGMPLTAGLEDTAHYNGQAYGFCSKECKSEFLKNPAAYVAKMK